MRSLLFLSVLLYSITITYAAADDIDKTKSRQRNLDHLSVDTLGYYLGIHPTTFEPVVVEGSSSSYVGYDVAIMFYAQWDRLSHTLAPYWDQIALNLKAGTQQSNLIMGLFDCELSVEHGKMCTEVGINAYPTLVFIGSNDKFRDTDPITRILKGKDKSAGPAGAAMLPRTVKFQGDWQYTDSIKDWIYAMQGLSTWNSWVSDGFVHNLRTRFVPFMRKNRRKNGNGNDDSLPVGIPSSSTANMQTLETSLMTITAAGELMERAATHASLLLDSVLFPPKDTDVFTILTSNGPAAWKKDNFNSDPETRVLRACVVELALDYCSRLSTRLTNEYVEELLASGFDATTANMEDVQAGLKKRLSEKEPYCAVFDDCFEQDFQSSEQCRPHVCPFSESAGCSYLTACLDTSIQTEYAIALNIIKEGETFPPDKVVDTQTTEDSNNNNNKRKKTGWLGN